jgi:hypothetical protein
VCLWHARTALVCDRSAHRPEQDLRVGALNGSNQGKTQEKHQQKNKAQPVSHHPCPPFALTSHPDGTTGDTALSLDGIFRDTWTFVATPTEKTTLVLRWSTAFPVG